MVKQDLASIDSLLNALHATISGPKSRPRDWGRFRSLFVAGAGLNRVVSPADSDAATIESMDVEQFIALFERELMGDNFHEREVSRKVEEFGRIAAVFSMYESRHAADGPTFQRGLNSFQLFRSPEGWRFVAILWDFERPGCPIPDHYLS